MQSSNKDPNKDIAKDLSNSDLDWTIDEEIKLFYALRYHKPVGVNRHFDMACIHDQFSKSVNKDIHSKTIWKYLEALYDMETLHENEDVCFPNEDFNLPPEYDKLKEEKTLETSSKSVKSVKSFDTSISQRTTRDNKKNKK